MHKFFVPKENINQDSALINGEDVKHIYKVLRLTKGEKVSINNCEGKEYLGELLSVDKKEVIVNLIEELGVSNESPIELTLFQGMPKAAKMDLIVQKCTELGVNEIIPIMTGRVVVKNEFGEFTKKDRLERIALEACKQSKRTFIPKIGDPVEFSAMMEKLKFFDLVVVPYENQKGYGIKKLMKEINAEVKKVAIIVGPEGGFEGDEISELLNVGAKIVTLGSRILRTETAGFVAATLLQYELGDLGGNV